MGWITTFLFAPAARWAAGSDLVMMCFFEGMADGSIRIPEVLKPYLSGQTVIAPDS